MPFVKVAKLPEIPAGSLKHVEVAGRALALANLDGRIYALDNTCPHRGGPLSMGFLDGENIECPLHAWQFNLRTGKCVFNESVVPTFPVAVEGDDVLVDIEAAAGGLDEPLLY